MKIFLYVTFYFYFTSVLTFAQSGWQNQTSPLGSEELGKVQFVSPTEGWITVKTGKLLHTTNAGTVWNVIVPWPTDNVSFFIDPPTAMSFVNASTGWLIGSLSDSMQNPIGGVIYKTTDGGTAWTRTHLPDCFQGVTVQFITPNVGWAGYLSFSNQVILRRTTDGGGNWSVVTTLIGKVGIPNFIDANIGWIWRDSLDSQFNFIPPFEILKTTDGGYNWDTQYLNNLIAINGRSNFTDVNNGWIVGKIQSGIDPKIFYTTNGRNDWMEVTNIQNPYGSPFQGITVYFLNQNIGWIAIRRVDEQGTSYVVQTTNGGASWTLQSIPCDYNISSIFFIDQNNGWLIGDGGCIAHTTTGGNVTSVEDETEISDQFTLHQNYPNPFNPSTKIKFTIPVVTLSGVEGSQVQLKVYDILGNEIATLVNEEQSPGEYEVEFSASGGNAYSLPSGMYFYQLKAGNFIQTKKMLLLK
jgi:photosystem II stability/assembly factor-like uncharacterized protein